ncbi:glycosyltransferase [Qipengyuania flava]|uniref:glycosyltransferase n=1 Tax=Qipengyuania flava TaxID=192812 RepID=UPI00268A14EC
MHIQIFSFLYGAGAEGICTERLCNSLSARGIRISLVTSDQSNIENPEIFERVEIISASPMRPQKVIRSISSLLCGVSPEFPVWCLKASRARVDHDVDLVYARTRPLSSAIPAQHAALKAGRPFVLHMSDPCPSPWHDHRSTEYARELKIYQSLIDTAVACTFTTAEAIEYQRHISPKLDDLPQIVIPHIIPDTVLDSPSKKGAREFLYIGTFYGARGPRTILEAFRMHLEEGHNSRLRILGANPDGIVPIIEELNLTKSVCLQKRVSDVSTYLASADVLLASDSFFRAPVFMSTKFVEYLTTRKRILLHSPSNSPSTKCIQGQDIAITPVIEDDPRSLSRAMSHECPDPTRAQIRRRQKFAARFEGQVIAKIAEEFFFGVTGQKSAAIS